MAQISRACDAMRSHCSQILQSLVSFTTCETATLAPLLLTAHVMAFIKTVPKLLNSLQNILAAEVWETYDF
jgi:hypothetical protein